MTTLRQQVEAEANKILDSFEYMGRRVIGLPLTVKETKERVILALQSYAKRCEELEKENEELRKGKS